MTYAEAILRLEKDPTLEFRLVEGYKTWTLKTDYDPRFPDDTVYYILECQSEDYTGGALEFNGNLSINDDRWVGVGHPVTWQEALEAWADGKRVSYTYPKDPVPYSFQESNRLMCVDKIKYASWYVED